MCAIEALAPMVAEQARLRRAERPASGSAAGARLGERSRADLRIVPGLALVMIRHLLVKAGARGGRGPHVMLCAIHSVCTVTVMQCMI